jgi:hypothetical protein
MGAVYIVAGDLVARMLLNETAYRENGVMFRWLLFLN